MAARLTRGKRKIVTAGIPFAVPDAVGAARPARRRRPDGLPRVHRRLRPGQRARPAARRPGRARPCGSCGSPSRCARDEPVLQALLALLLLQHSRRDARVGRRRPARAAARPGPLALAPRRGRRGGSRSSTGCRRTLTSALAESYRLQALVAAEHATAATASDTRWDRICEHYAALVALNPSPAVRLAAAVALAERDGPRAGLAALDDLDDALPHSHRLPAVRGELLARAGERRRGRRGPRPRDRPLPATTSSASTSPAAATSWRPPGSSSRATRRRRARADIGVLPPSRPGPLRRGQVEPRPGGGAGRPRRREQRPPPVHAVGRRRCPARP